MCTNMCMGHLNTFFPPWHVAIALIIIIFHGFAVWQLEINLLVVKRNIQIKACIIHYCTVMLCRVACTLLAFTVRYIIISIIKELV